MNFQVDGQFRTRMPGIFAIGDVAAFPLKVHLCLIKQLLPFSLSTSLLFCFLGFWHMFWPNRCMTVQHEWNMLIMLVDPHSIALKHYLVHKLTRISNFLLWLKTLFVCLSLSSTYIFINNFIPAWTPDMIIFHIFTRGFLSMKEAPGKCGGSFLETMVRISYIFISWSFHNLFFFHKFCLILTCNFIVQLERQLKLEILILKLPLSG